MPIRVSHCPTHITHATYTTYTKHMLKGPNNMIFFNVFLHFFSLSVHFKYCHREFTHRSQTVVAFVSPRNHYINITNFQLLGCFTERKTTLALSRYYGKTYLFIHIKESTERVES